MAQNKEVKATIWGIWGISWCCIIDSKFFFFISL